MSYYATGSGSIAFRDVLSEEKLEDVEDVFEGVMECDCVRKFKTRGSVSSCVDLWDNDKYYGEEVEEALEKASEIAEISEGCVEYTGEDGERWRFIYRDGKWHEENAQVVYEDVVPLHKLRAAYYDFMAVNEGDEATQNIIKVLCAEVLDIDEDDVEDFFKKKEVC